MKDFYVDDLVKAVPNIEEPIRIIQSTTKICKDGGFRLTKFTSNNREVNKSVPREDGAKNIKSLDLSQEELPIEKALGVHWPIGNDVLGFRITLQDEPLTRRGILSTITHHKDQTRRHLHPLRPAAPFLLKGRKIMQSLCKDKANWDDDVPDTLKKIWEQWRIELPL